MRIAFQRLNLTHQVFATTMIPKIVKFMDEYICGVRLWIVLPFLVMLEKAAEELQELIQVFKIAI